MWYSFSSFCYYILWSEPISGKRNSQTVGFYNMSCVYNVYDYKRQLTLVLIMMHMCCFSIWGKTIWLPYVEENVVGHNFEGWLQNSILTVPLSMTNFRLRSNKKKMHLHVKVEQQSLCPRLTLVKQHEKDILWKGSNIKRLKKPIL